jgi:hypothetical protein
MVPAVPRTTIAATAMKAGSAQDKLRGIQESARQRKGVETAPSLSVSRLYLSSLLYNRGVERRRESTGY